MLGLAVVRSLGAPAGPADALLERTTDQSATPAPLLPTQSRWSRIHVRDPYVRDAVMRGLDDAADRLKTATCQALLTEFVDHEGRLLKDRLTALNLTSQEYLGVLLFEDGDIGPQCERPGVLAFTAAGSRVVRVCGRAFSRASRQDPAEGWAVIIHELLHSLGLGENPPEPRHITHRVRKSCW